MKQSSKEPYDPSRPVLADKKRVVEAYELWRKTARLPARGTGRESEKIFYNEIARCFDMARRSPPIDIGIPKSRSGISSWRNPSGTQTKSLRYDVCEFIRHLSGVDVTSNGFLDSEPLNISDMANLGRVLAKGTEAKNSPRMYHMVQIQIEHLEFSMSGIKNIKRDDLELHGDLDSKGPNMGTVRYLVAEANVSVNGVDTVESFQWAEDTPKHHIQLAADNELRTSLRAVPRYPNEVLQAKIEKISLLCVPKTTDQTFAVCVEVDRCHVLPIVNFSTSSLPTDRQTEIARRNLINQIFRKRLPGGTSPDKLVLSRALGKISD